jgi:predicted PurR-regulated permease PerM
MLQYFLDHTFSIALGSSIAAMIYRAAFRIVVTFIALLNFYADGRPLKTRFNRCAPK